MKAYKDTPAYVLLAEPGMGKTTAFKQYAEDQVNAEYITARDLITLKHRQIWENKILFIDGLDEVRAGTHDARGPFDKIRACLEKLGRPRFRLSCREADWFSNDRERLAKVAPGGEPIRLLHLDELTEQDVRAILTQNYSTQIDDADSFISEAQRLDLYDLLKNPQTLDLMVSALQGDGTWPTSRRETFELACRRILVREQNPEHTIASYNQAQSIDKQLQAAGYLCTVLLLADKPGLAMTEAAATESYPFIGELDFPERSLLLAVTKTKLFRVENERAEYAHRTVAEYLAAAYLASRTEEDLPIERVLALMTGTDGLAVTALRGLFAWLVTLRSGEHDPLLAWDPWGLVLYGDVKSFGIDEKHSIVLALKATAVAEENLSLPITYSSENSFGALCTEGMESTFREVLTSFDRSRAHQLATYAVLHAMMNGILMPKLTGCLMEIVYDPTWWPGVRRRALEVLIGLVSATPGSMDVLCQLLADVHENRVSDEDDNFLGMLLEALYSDVVSTGEVFDYLHAPKDPGHFGHYEQFWITGLIDSSSDRELRELLDELVSRRSKLDDVLKEIHFQSMVTKLLTKGLEIHGEAVGTETLSAWLGLGLDEHGFAFRAREQEFEAIRKWLSDHPGCQKAMTQLHSRQCSGSKQFDWCMHKAKARFYDADLPADYGVWCLAEAKRAADDSIGQWLFEEAVRTCFYANQGKERLSFELLEQAAGEHPRFKAWLQPMVYRPIDDEHRSYRHQVNERRKQEETEKGKHIEFIRSNIDSIESGNAYTGILHNLGMAYYGRYVDFEGSTPRERLTHYFQDQALVDGILAGLKACTQWGDIPDEDEIFEINANGRIHHLSLPFRAGLEEITQKDLECILQLSVEKIRAALAFQMADGYGDEPAWFILLIEHRPKLIADIMIKYVRSALRKKTEHIAGIWSIAFDPRYAEVARQAALPLLESFPVRGSSRQLESLEHLLKAAYQHADREQFRKLIERKLDARSMNVAQRVHWVALGFLVAPDEYDTLLTSYVDGKTGRIKLLAGLLSHRDDQFFLDKDLPAFAMAQLIRILGSHYKPYKIVGGAGWVTPDMEASDHIQGLINRLAAIEDDDATQALEELLEDDRLAQWRHMLQGALYGQIANKREVRFSHPSVEQVCRTLQNRTPANVADLAAVTAEQLRKLNKQIKDGNTNDYGQYWNVQFEGRRRIYVGRKHEDDCTNALLSDLKQRLSKQDITAEPQGTYADEKRADIRVSYGDFHVPIEIKCNDHRDVWHAIHNQLIPKYTRDPGAQGFGIFVVFWFGAKGTPPPPEGPIPKTAQAFEDRLFGLLKSDDQRRQITVCVIDCSAPGQRAQ